MVEELRPLAERVLELPASAEHYEPETRAALHHLERELFEPEPERIDPGHAIALLEAGGELAEAELAAAEVLALIRAGVPGEEIAVVYRSPAHAASLVEHVFGSYGIAVATDRRTALDRTPLGHSLLALARCALVQGDREATSRGPARVPARARAARPRRRGRPPRGRGPPRRAANTSPRPASARASSSPRSTRCAPPRIPRRSCSRTPGDCWPLRTAARAPVLDADEELDARALGTLARALAELEELGEKPTGAELIELLETLELPAGPLRPRPARCS